MYVNWDGRTFLSCQNDGVYIPFSTLRARQNTLGLKSKDSKVMEFICMNDIFKQPQTSHLWIIKYNSNYLLLLKNESVLVILHNRYFRILSVFLSKSVKFASKTCFYQKIALFSRWLQHGILIKRGVVLTRIR